MKNKKIRRMMYLYDKMVDGIWYETNRITEEEAEELSQLCREYRAAGYPEMEEEK